MDRSMRDMSNSQLIAVLKSFDDKITADYKIAKKLQKESANDYKELQKDLLKLFQSSGIIIKSVCLFGSRIAGVGGHHSDIDIALEIDYCGNIFKQTEAMRKTLYYKALALLDNSRFFEYGSHRPDLPIPSIKVRHQSGLFCDIVLNHTAGFKKSLAIRQCLKIQDPEATKFLIYLRKVFAMTSLKTIHFHKILDVLAIAFLQIEKYLPSLRDMQENPYNAESTDFIQFKNPFFSYGLYQMTDYKLLLVPFFNFYKKFDWQSFLICPYLGRAVSKRQFLELSELIMHPEHYGINMHRSLICTDFYDLSFNHAYEMESHHVLEFKRICEDLSVLFSR